MDLVTPEKVAVRAGLPTPLDAERTWTVVKAALRRSDFDPAVDYIRIESSLAAEGVGPHLLGAVALRHPGRGDLHPPLLTWT
jgi:hypothetical protein